MFVAARTLVNFALNGEWSLGSMLVAETWPARLRGRVIGINRGTWCFGAALAGVIATLVMAEYGWRIACLVPAAVALLAVYVRRSVRNRPIGSARRTASAASRSAQARGAPVSAEDGAWIDKARKVRCGSSSCPTCARGTAVATFVACCSTIIFGTVGGWMPLYLAQERHWSTAMYGSFYIAWGAAGFLGLLCAGWISDRFGRRPAFYVMLAEGAVFITLWPFVAVALQQRTGSFADAFLLIPVVMVLMAVGVWLFVPDHAGKDLDAIGV